MRWSDCHVGNVAQAPVEGQPVVNPKLKVPKGQGVVPDTLEQEVGPEDALKDTKAEDRERQAKADDESKAPPRSGSSSTSSTSSSHR